TWIDKMHWQATASPTGGPPSGHRNFTPCRLLVCPVCSNGRATAANHSSSTVSNDVGCLAGDCDAGCLGMLLLTGCLLCCLIGTFLIAWLFGRRYLPSTRRQQSPDASPLLQSVSSASCEHQWRPAYYGAINADEDQLQCADSTTPTTYSYSASITSSMASLIAQSAAVGNGGGEGGELVDDNRSRSSAARASATVLGKPLQ
ncbi:hypothetical protein BOX15_Mlig027241g1, partial [Macrostomum lignano]